MSSIIASIVKFNDAKDNITNISMFNQPVVSPPRPSHIKGEDPDWWS